MWLTQYSTKASAYFVSEAVPSRCHGAASPRHLAVVAHIATTLAFFSGGTARWTVRRILAAIESAAGPPAGRMSAEVMIGTSAGPTNSNIVRTWNDILPWKFVETFALRPCFLASPIPCQRAPFFVRATATNVPPPARRKRPLAGSDGTPPSHACCSILIFGREVGGAWCRPPGAPAGPDPRGRRVIT